MIEMAQEDEGKVKERRWTEIAMALCLSKWRTLTRKVATQWASKVS